MATSVAAHPARVSRSGIVLALSLLAVLGVAGKFLIHYALPYFAFDPTYFDYYWPHRFRLITHVCGGILALSCGPFQFWTGLRGKALGIHRWTGRLYLLGVLVGASGAGMMAYFTQPRNFGVSLGFMALAWVLCTGIAYLAILRGLVPLHKEWMVRSYLITFGFVTFRLINDYPPGIGWGTVEDRVATLTWACWALPLLGYEIVRAAQRLLAAKPA
jgi:hypothetical protein